MKDRERERGSVCKSDGKKGRAQWSGREGERERREMARKSAMGWRGESEERESG